MAESSLMEALDGRLYIKFSLSFSERGIGAEGLDDDDKEGDL